MFCAKGLVKIKDVEKILRMEFKQKLDRKLTVKEEELIRWMATQQSSKTKPASHKRIYHFPRK